MVCLVWVVCSYARRFIRWVAYGWFGLVGCCALVWCGY